MIRMTLLALAAALGLSAQAHAQEEWKWGVNFYDLQLHSIPDEGSAVAADICSASLMKMAALTMDQEGSTDAFHQIVTLANVWTAEGASRRGMDLEAYKQEYMLPAFSVMRELHIDHLQFWTEHCLELTRKFVD